MCFTIPYEVLKVNKKSALIEGGKKVAIGKESKVKVGDFLRITDNIATDHLTKEEGNSIRSLINSVYHHNE